MVRANLRLLDENEQIKYVMRAAKASGKTNEFIEASGVMPINDTAQRQGNLKTQNLLRNKDAQEDLLFHSRKNDEKEAAIYIWNHPEKMQYVRFSPLGEVKSMQTEKDKKNIKKKRGAIGYNQYKFSYKKKIYLVKLEVRKKGFEVPYHLERKRT